MRDSLVGVGEEPCQDGQQGSTRSVAKERWAGWKTFLCCRRKTRSACNGKSCCSFSTRYFYETTTSPSFHPTTNIAEGGARGVRVPRGAVGPRPVLGPPGRFETRHEWSVRREWKSTGSQAGSPAGGPLLTMTALPLINTRFLIPVCFSLLCNLLYQTGMGVSPTGT